MSQFTAPFAALDADTREYLREVRKRQGDRTPGVYFHRTNMWPVGAFLLGPCVIVLGVLFAVGSSKDAWAVALLLTAAVLLGGWLIAYAFRRWLAGGSPGFAGYFTYFDPTHVYDARGDQVTVRPLSPNTPVTIRHNLSDGKYSNSTIAFQAGGRPATVTVTTQPGAELLGFYYEAVGWLKAHEDPRWRELPAAERGGVAKYMAAADELPRDMKDVNLEVAAVPADPRADGKAPGNGLRYLVLIGLTGLLYLALWGTMVPTADALAYEAAKDSPHGLRAYLLDERNTRHRDEAKQRLAALYAPAEAKAQSGPNPQLKGALLALLAELKQSPTPVTSLDVFETQRQPAAVGWSRDTRTHLADAIATHLGPELIAFVEPPAGTKPHIEVEYRTETAARPENGQRLGLAGPTGPKTRVVYRVRVRPTPEAAAAEGPEAEFTFDPSGQVVIPGMLTGVPRELRANVFRQLFGVEPPPVAVPRFDTGDGEW